MPQISARKVKYQMRKEIYGYLIIRLHERDESLNVFLICHQLLSPTIIFRAKFPSHNKIQLNTSSPPQFQTHSKTRSTYRLQNNTRFLTKHDKHDPLKEISTPIRGINSRGAALIKPPSKSLFHRSTPPPFPPSPLPDLLNIGSIRPNGIRVLRARVARGRA